MSCMPRRIHPTSVIMRKEIDKCYTYYGKMRLGRCDHDDMWDMHYYCMEILTPYKEMFELDKYCDCCCESWADCQCMCKCGDDYKECRAMCEVNNVLILRRLNEKGIVIVAVSCGVIVGVGVIVVMGSIMNVKVSVIVMMKVRVEMNELKIKK